MCGKGSNTTTSTTGPNPQAMAAYSDVLGKAASAGSTPYAPYTGEEVAPINQQQMAGVGGINAAAGQAQSGIQAGFGQIQGSSQPITASQIQGYESPYTNDVVNATEADFAHQNAVGQAGVVGNAAAQNALGGDRVGVAQALTAEGQSRSQAPVIAGLRNTGFQTALGAAENQQRTGLAGGQAMVGAAGAGQAAAMQGANAQIGAGTLEQGTQQAQDTQARQDYFQKMGYPFQIAQYLASIDTAVGSQMGGQSTTEGPAPNPWTQIAGLGLAGASMFLPKQRGGSISGFAPERRHRASGGYNGPWDGSDSWVPSMQPVHGKGPPAAPAAPKQQGLSADQMKGVGVLGKDVSKWWDNQDADPGSASNPLPGLSPDDYAARGGRIRRYATGGFAYGGPPEWLDDAVADNHDYTPTVAGLGATEPAVSFNSRFDAAPAERPDDAKGRNYLKNYFSTGPTPDSQAALGRGFQQPDEAEVIPFPKSRPPNADKPIPPNTGEVDTADAGVGAIDRAAHIPAPANDDESLGYQPKERTPGFAPTSLAPQEDKSWLEKLGVRVTPELKQGLLQAGLAMMATHRGGPGSFLGAAGEAGIAGVGAYNKSQEAQTAEEERLRKAAIEEENQNLKVAAAPILPGGKLNPAWKAMERWKADELSKDNWAPLPGNGIDPDRMYNKASGEVKNVPAPANPTSAASAPSGQFDYRMDSPKVNKGDTVPEPAVISGHSSDLLKRDAELYLTNGQLPKASVSARSDVGKAQMIYQRAVQNYGVALAASKGMNMAQMADLQRFGTNAARFPLSRQGDQTVAIGTAIRHLGALEEYAKAWDAAKGNVNAPILRQAAARFATFLGREEPTNLEQASRIAGPEVIKAIGVAGAGTGGERIEQERGFQPGASTAQILGSADVARKFLAGQLPAKEAQARNVGFPHDRFMDMVGPQEYDYLSAINHGKVPEGGGGAAPVSVKTKEEAAALKPGTHYRTPDGRELIR